LPGLDAALPRLHRGLERAELRWDHARRLVAELMAAIATVGLDLVKPLQLALYRGGHAVAVRAGAREHLLAGNVEHRIPVDGRIIFRCRSLAGRRHRGDVHDLTGLAGGLG